MTLTHLTGALSSSAHSLSGGALEGGVDVDFDATVFVQVAMFVILLIVLKPLLFTPMLKLFEEREKRIDGAKLQARKMDEKSAGALTKYEAAMAEARAKANAERETLRGEGMKAEAELLAKVRVATAMMLDKGRTSALEEASHTRRELAGEATQIAKELASRVLGREVSG